MKTKMPGVTLVKAHTNKWTVYDNGKLAGHVRRTNRSLRGSDYVFYWQRKDVPEWHGGYDTRMEAVEGMFSGG